MDPVLFSIVQWVNHFWHELIRFSNLKHGSGVLVSSAVISSRENSEKATSSKSFESVHNTLVRSQDETCFIIFKESLDSIWAKFDNISSSVRVSHKVWLDSKLTVRVSWVTPENVNNQLLLHRRDLVYYFKWSSDLLNLLKAYKGASNTTVKADDSIFDDSREREPVKEFINLVEDRVMFRWVFSESVTALFSEAKGIVDPLILVVTSQKMNLVWESDLQRHEQADCFERVTSSVDVISQEEVVVALDITVFIWSSPKIEESHQILVLTMDVTKNLDRGVNFEDHWLCFKNFLSFIGKS